MKEKALVGIDIQNDITKNYKEIIENINAAVGWAVDHDIHVVYIKHNNLSAIYPLGRGPLSPIRAGRSRYPI